MGRRTVLVRIQRLRRPRHRSRTNRFGPQEGARLHRGDERRRIDRPILRGDRINPQERTVSYDAGKGRPRKRRSKPCARGDGDGSPPSRPLPRRRQERHPDRNHGRQERDGAEAPMQPARDRPHARIPRRPRLQDCRGERGRSLPGPRDGHLDAWTFHIDLIADLDGVKAGGKPDSAPRRSPAERRGPVGHNTVDRPRRRPFAGEHEVVQTARRNFPCPPPDRDDAGRAAGTRVDAVEINRCHATGLELVSIAVVGH